MDCVWVDEPSRRGALAVVKKDFIFNFMSDDKLLWVLGCVFGEQYVCAMVDV